MCAGRIARHDSGMRTHLAALHRSANPTRYPTPVGSAGTRSATPVIGIAGVAAGAFALEMALSARYGYHRDEFYFLAASRHLALGYVDQPPLTPLLVRFSSVVFGDSLIGLRLFGALAMAALVVITAAMSRVLGAGRGGQTLAALASAPFAGGLRALHPVPPT